LSLFLFYDHKNGIGLFQVSFFSMLMCVSSA
jgi:hypothetical protein